MTRRKGPDGPANSADRRRRAAAQVQASFQLGRVSERPHNAKPSHPARRRSRCRVDWDGRRRRIRTAVRASQLHIGDGWLRRIQHRRTGVCRLAHRRRPGEHGGGARILARWLAGAPAEGRRLSRSSRAISSRQRARDARLRGAECRDPRPCRARRRCSRRLSRLHQSCRRGDPRRQARRAALLQSISNARASNEPQADINTVGTVITGHVDR
jgi:hypothetical protein